MPAEVEQSSNGKPIIQFSVFADNKVGRLNELLHNLAKHEIAVMGLAQLDATDCSVMRFIPNYPEATRKMLTEVGYPYTECNLLVVEIPSEASLKRISATLLEAEINIDYLYPLLTRPGINCALALHVEDLSFARHAMAHRGLRCLGLEDIAR
jgi:hypothetical protein